MYRRSDKGTSCNYSEPRKSFHLNFQERKHTVLAVLLSVLLILMASMLGHVCLTCFRFDGGDAEGEEQAQVDKNKGNNVITSELSLWQTTNRTTVA